MTWIETKIARRRDWAPGLMSLELEARAQTFVPGQFINLGLDIAGIDSETLRSCLSVVSQDPVLFSASIAENVRYGYPDASAAQVAEARAAGAGAILLIARALDPAEAPELADAAMRCGLDVLFEVRDEAELARGVDIRGAAIGVNTRNLETLEIDPVVGERLLPLIPRDRVAVYESGVATRADVERAAGCGADAVLVGSALSRADDPVAAVQALTGVAVRGRG